jgi:hypothetical protein
MKVDARVLDSRDDGSSKCFLSSMSLEDYVNALSSSYQDYDVQREIVSNVYLDHLVETVLNRRHIPPIVLVVDGGGYHINGNLLQLQSFKILDGLQRTFRLQAIRKTIEFCCNSLDPNENYLSWTKFKFSRTFASQLHEFDSNTDVLRAIVQVFQKEGENGLLKTFTKNNQWFEIWVGLTPEEEVRKMLMLNAGHKPVKTRHQLELLFLNLLPVLREGEGQEFTLVREKEISATQFSKRRQTGTFHFAHVITALLSFYEGKPIAPSTSLIQGIQSADSGVDSYMELADPTILKAVVAFLVRLDRELTSQYGENGSLWMGREVSLAGLFGAMGAVADETGRSRVDVMNTFYEICRRNPQILNLHQFEEVRNNLDLSKVNIGNVNRSAVFSAIKEILGTMPPNMADWRRHFGVEGK